MMKCMPIDSAEGTKVKYAYPNNGTNSDKLMLQHHGLEVGGEYTVERTIVYSFSSVVYLKEYPGVMFNTVNFTLS